MLRGWRFAALGIALVASASGCGGGGSPTDAGMGEDADAATDAVVGDAELDAFVPLLDLDGTDRLEPCGEDGSSRCAPPQPWMRGRWSFYFACPITSIWEVTLASEELPASLRVLDSEGTVDESLAPALDHAIAFTSLDALGTCRAIVELPEDGRFELAISQIEPPLDDVACDELCLSDSASGIARGCDCDRTCHNACSPFGMDCGLPCNRDVPGYDCPFLEAEIAENDDCTYYESDTDSFEHRGRCYRCGDGNQCCYSDGFDNGTGSFDLCPPLDPGANDPDPNGCSGVFDHCDCDVTPLCGCMAEVGELELCNDCIGIENVGLSCNAPGDDATFCRRAADAALAGFGWCERLYDVGTCFDLPDDF